MQSTVLSASNTLNKAPILVVFTFRNRKPDDETSKIHGQNNQVVINAMKKTKQGDRIVQGGGCSWVVRESFSEEVIFS